MGVLRYELGGKALGEVEIYADGQVDKAGYRDYLKKAAKAWLTGTTGDGNRKEEQGTEGLEGA